MILHSSVVNKRQRSPDIPFPWFILYITVASCPALHSCQITPSNLTLLSRCRPDKCQRCPAAGNNNPQASALLQNAITASTVRLDFGSDLFDLFRREGFHVHAERYCLIYQILLWGKRWITPRSTVCSCAQMVVSVLVMLLFVNCLHVCLHMHVCVMCHYCKMSLTLSTMWTDATKDVHKDG